MILVEDAIINRRIHNLKYNCNPMNIEYKYQFINMLIKNTVTRESADPSLILFNNEYYLFPSMLGGFLVSDDLAEWKYYPFRNLPIHDYAPDACVIGEYMYFCASKNNGLCSFYRCKDPKNELFEEIPSGFTFFDPNLFCDEDGRVYFYWGSSNKIPIKGVEINNEDFTQKGEIKELFLNHMDICGYERKGEDHKTKDGLIAKLLSNISDCNPHIEGAWMTKYNQKYYLQYAAPGAEVNVYLDGVYESEHPLGPFTLARNNPYSYKPGGFCPGAGHGSTMEDKHGNLWHISTMRISVGHMFERRLGLWPAGFDKDGELFCNQRFGDWVYPVPDKIINPWTDPEWMLLSSGKKMKASSYCKGHEPNKASEENVRTWWKAASNQANEWIMIDLGETMDVRAIQINFADDNLKEKKPENALIGGGLDFGTPPLKVNIMNRYIDMRAHFTRWMLEGSTDGLEFIMIEDKTNADTDLSHDLVVREDGLHIRYIKLTVKEIPMNQPATVSGLRVFGKSNKKPPQKAANVKAKRLNDFDMEVSFDASDAMGCNILWGHDKNKLYHSNMMFGETKKEIRALIKGEKYYAQVDVFNEGGITKGDIIEVK